MAIGTGTIVLLAAGVYAATQFAKPKKKKKKSSNGGSTVPRGDTPSTGPSEDYGITWGDIDNCSDWILEDAWKENHAQPIFDAWVEEAKQFIETVTEDQLAEALARGGEMDPFFDPINPLVLVHRILDGQLPEHCVVPPLDFRGLQTTSSSMPNYFTGSDAVLALYWHVLEAVEWAAEDIGQGGQGLLWPPFIP